MKENLVNSDQLAELFKVHKNTLTSWEHQGLPVHRMTENARIKYYFLDEVFEFLKKKK